MLPHAIVISGQWTTIAAWPWNLHPLL